MHRLIIRLPNWIGDAVMATPLLEILKNRYPEVEIIACAPSHILELFQGLPFFNKTVSIRSRSDVVSSIESLKADTGLLLTGSFSSAYHFWKAKIPNRIGFSCHLRSLFLTKAIAIPHTGHDVQKYLKLLTAFSNDPISESTPLHLAILPEEKEAFARRLADIGISPSHKVLVVNPGAAYGEAKCWPKEYFKTVITHLSANPSLRIIITGNTAQKKLADELTKGTPHVYSFAGNTTIRELMALIERADCLLTNDSGPMHIAAALKTPLIALFGSTNPKRTAPWNVGKVLYKEVSCSPCFKRTCKKDFCCMTTITPNMVLHAVCAELGVPHDL